MAVTVLPLVLLSPVAGVHVYVFAPLAVNVADVPPEHIVPLVTVTAGLEVTVTVDVAETEHPATDVPVIV